jgi:two-component system, OmpR family, response regulator
LPSQSGIREAPSGGLPDLVFKPRSVPRPAAVPLEQPAVVRMPAVATPEYHVLAGGTVMGPLGLAKLTELVAIGKLDPSALVSEDGVLFQPLRELEELSRLCQRRAFSFSESPENRPEWRHPLERARLPALIITLIRRQATGLLRARDSQREKRVYFAAGAPCFVCSTEPEELTGARLVSAGLVSESDIERALALACDRGQRRLGEVLVQHAVLRPTALLRALVEQLEARFSSLFTWTAGTLAFHPGEQSGEEAIALPRAPGVLVADAVRAHYSERELSELLGPLAARPIARGPLPAVELGLTGAEQRALERAPGSISLHDLVGKLESRGSARRADAHRAVLLGLSSGTLVMPGWPVPVA